MQDLKKCPTNENKVKNTFMINGQLHKKLIYGLSSHSTTKCYPRKMKTCLYNDTDLIAAHWK